MKQLKKGFVGLFLVAVAVIFLTGCEPKREALKFDGEEGTLTFNVKADGGYKISTDQKDFRNSREQGMLIGKDFKISIEFDDTFGYFFDGDFSKLKAKRKDSYKDDQYKEVKYSDLDGFQYFYSGYNSYTIYLPVEGDKEHVLVLSVYGKEDKEAAAKEAIENEEVQDVLNHISDIAGKKN